MDLKTVIRAIPDFPKPGIIFQDITPVMQNPAAYKSALDGMTALIQDTPVDSFAGIESRGFIFAGPMAVDQNKPMILMRKAGKLPAETHAVTYALEYGEATLEVHKDSIKPGDRVMIVDDLLATGGTAIATAQLVTECGGQVAGFLFMVELAFLEGRQKLEALGPVFSLVNYS